MGRRDSDARATPEELRKRPDSRPDDERYTRRPPAGMFMISAAGDQVALVYETFATESTHAPRDS